MADRILIADDEADILNLAKMMLEAKGYEVVTASTGEDALAKVFSEKPDIIILDVVIPDKGGFEVCKALKAEQKTNSIPVIMFTILSRDIDKKLGKKAGADSYLTKPFTFNELTSVVESNLNNARPNKFSSTLGLNHSKIAGRKILFEINHTSHYERFIRDFAIEFKANGETVIVLTPTASSIHKAIEGDGDLIIRETSIPHLQSLPSIIKASSAKPLALVYDNLTDLTFSAGFRDAYDFTKKTLKLLSNKRMTALFLINTFIHSKTENERYRNLFKDKIGFDINGLSKIHLS